jgi:hypothetical protein
MNMSRHTQQKHQQSHSQPIRASLDATLQRLEEDHRARQHQLDGIGLVLRGSIGARMVRCGKPTCRPKADPPFLHGPYYLWTRKVAAKTVTVQLTAEQAARCQLWIRNIRRLDRLVKELQALGLRAARTLLRST